MKRQTSKYFFYTVIVVVVIAACGLLLSFGLQKYYNARYPMEYRGVYLRTRQEIFHFGPMQGTNNIGEFLAIVHALALLDQKHLSMPVYSDSRTAISWVRQKKCKTKLERTPQTEPLFALIERAEHWLHTHTYATPILKWETERWGEVPADFGRK